VSSDRSDFLKFQGTEVTVNNSVANTVGGSSFVRIVNTGAGYTLVTQQRSGQANVSLSVPPSGVVYLAKHPSDTITSNSASSVVAVGVKTF
jgi:hypothetical protein